MLSYEIVGLDKLVKKYGKGAKPIIRDVTRGIGEELVKALAHYPGPVVYPVQWVSPAQRAAYFAKRRKHGLGPYVRNSDPFSERLGPSWATEERGEVNTVVGTRVSYAPWVQSAKEQQPMHRATGWVTDEQAIEEVRASGAAERILDDALGKW